MRVQLPTTITISFDNVRGKNTNIYVAEKFTEEKRRKAFIT